MVSQPEQISVRLQGAEERKRAQNVAESESPKLIPALRMCDCSWNRVKKCAGCGRAHLNECAENLCVVGYLDPSQTFCRKCRGGVCSCKDKAAMCSSCLKPHMATCLGEGSTCGACTVFLQLPLVPPGTCVVCDLLHKNLRALPCYSLRPGRTANICCRCRQRFDTTVPCRCDCKVNQNPECKHGRKFARHGCHCGWCDSLRSDRVDAWLEESDGGPEVSTGEKVAVFLKEMEMDALNE